MAAPWKALLRLLEKRPERRVDWVERGRREMAAKEEQRKRLALRRKGLFPPPIPF